MSTKQKLIVIAGPTASGKTACAVELCRAIGGEVVSADSMQLYRGMDILSAMPTPEEMAGIPHHMLGIADPREKYSAARYRDAVRPILSDIAARGRRAVLCGGSGLYINAVTRPMAFSERCDEALRRSLLALSEKPGGKALLFEELRRVDPESAARLHENDVRRVTRAIEIYRLTGRTQTQLSREDAAREGDYDETFFAPDWPREALYRRIDARVDAMLAAGLIEEVERLRRDEQAHPTALQAIGYKEIAAALDGRMTMDEAVEAVKRASRVYAKKQLTWFRRDPRVVRLTAEGRSPKDLAREIIKHLEDRYHENIRL